MATLKSIELEVEGTKDLALLAADDSVWLVIPIRWYDLATIIWWLLAPADRRANVTLTTKAGTETQKVKFRAMRVASRHIRVRGVIVQ
jgi:hypothetical protein